jgi:hypothetical protein
VIPIPKAAGGSNIGAPPIRHQKENAPMTRARRRRTPKGWRSPYKSPTWFTRTIRTLIGLASTALLLIFTLINFRHFPTDIIASTTTPLVLWQSALWLYYFSWAYGTLFDVNVQEDVYVAFPERGRVPVHGFIVVLLLTVAGAALLWTARDIQRFAIAIDIFIVVDHLAWIYLIWLIRPVVEDSKTTFVQDRNYFAVEALKTVTYHIQGPWKWWRLPALCRS